jgi:hypothetical protein
MTFHSDRGDNKMAASKPFKGDIVYDYGYIALNTFSGRSFDITEMKLREFCVRFSLRKNRPTQKPRYLIGKLLKIFKPNQPKPFKIFMKTKSLYSKGI